MKLILLVQLYIWIFITKDIRSKSKITSSDDFIVNLNENFRSKFQNEEKVEKFKKNVIKKMRNIIKERLFRKSMILEFLELKNKAKAATNTKKYLKTNKKNKNLKNLKKIRSKKFSHNSTIIHHSVKNITTEIIKPSIQMDEINFIALQNQTLQNKNLFRIDFKLENSSIKTKSNNFMSEVYEEKNLKINKKQNNEKNKIDGTKLDDILDNHNNLKSLMINDFKNYTNQEMIQKKDQKSEFLYSNLNFPENKSEILSNYKKETDLFNISGQINSHNFNLSESKYDFKKNSKRRKSNSNLDIFDWSFGDINSNKRVTKFYINLESKCNIFINDTIYYDRDDYTSNFIDHLILHNNFDSIEPRSIYSNDVMINYFIYNKKLNMFTVNFENENHKNYSIVYEYYANNLIKLQPNKKDFYSNTEKNVNEFLWKFYNENTNSKNLSLEVEFYFTIDKWFMNENVEFNNKMFMYKTLIENKDTLVFKWNGTLMPYEVKVFESVFPMIFENCQTMTVNFTMILIGAFFVIFIVLILYLLFSSIAKDLN